MTMSFQLPISKLHRAIKQQVANSIDNSQLLIAATLPFATSNLTIETGGCS